ncbi:MAG: DUF262 domain-containing protein [Bacillota bacterium]|nr:DUF262 domain-containing protein [Bacillota bacterium]
MKFKDVPKFTSEGQYNADMRLPYFIRWIDENIKELGLQLNPDFQRGNVWTEQQQIAYIEYLIKGGKSAITVYFNQPGWQRDYKGEFVCVDGLQRITAMQKFLNNKIKIFGHYLNEYEDSKILLRKLIIKVNINNLQTKKEVLQWYLDMNTGGTVHSEKEIDKVKNMINELEKEN